MRANAGPVRNPRLHCVLASRTKRERTGREVQPSVPPVARGPTTLWTGWIYILLAVLTIGTYAQVFTHDFVIDDDPDYITENSHVQAGLTWEGAEWAFTSGYAANWHPLTWLSHMLDWQLFGARAGWHHMMSVLIHAISVLLLFRVLRRMTGAVYRSAFVALAFALHPLHVESIAWAAERKDVLSGLFFFLTLWAYLNYIQRPAIWRYVLVTVAFACGLMAKPMLVTLPLVLVLLDIWPLKRFGRSAIFEKLPLLLLALASAVITFLVQQRSGAVAALGETPIGLRIENALVSYVVYLEKFIWPSNLAVFYPYPQLDWLKAALAGVAILGITLGVAVAFRKRPYLAVGWLWYVVTLIPVIGLVQVGLQARADRYTYIPAIGLAIVVAWSAAEFLPPRLAAIGGSAVVAAWTIVSWNQIGIWQDSATLFQHANEVTSGNYVADYGLATVLGNEGRPKDAEAEYRAALKLRPDSAKARVGLGVALMAQGRAEEALPQLLEATRLSPNDADAHYNLGSAYGALDRSEEAVAQFSDAVRLKPSDPSAHYNLGTALVSAGRMPDAVSEFAAAVRLKPDYVGARFNLANALASTGHLDEAIAEFTEVLRLQPDLEPARQSLERCRMLKKSGQ
jgi:Flp pilus assembly protein TadD